jgi:thiol:disulfide interchange protein DsbD
MFMALTFTLTSFTCTFAFAGTLLVGAAGGDYYWPVIGMLAFGTAFASPFFVLAMVPSLLKKLPKSGGWMNTIKVVMGLIEIGAAIKFWSVADFAWNPVEPFLFDFVFVMLSWLVLSLVIGLYLLGVFRMAHDVPPAGLSVMRLAMAVAFLGLSGNLAVALLKPGPGGGWVMEQIVSMAPPQPAEDVPAVAGGHPTNLPEPNINHHGIWYALDFDKAVAHAAVVNQPILLDFTGVNCANCRKMELRMPKAHNRSRLEKFVLVQLYVDTVPISDPVELKRLLVRNRNLQKELLNDSSMPEYAVVTPDGKTLLASFTQGLESKEGEFAAFLDEGWKNWEQMQPKAKGVEVVNKP